MTDTTITPLKEGATGRAVAFLQSRLGLPSTGSFDAATTAALRTAQASRNVAPDGVYGPLTNFALTHVTPQTRDGLAASLGVEPAAFAAVLAVETNGAGFYANGLPKILLERHYVYALATPAARNSLPVSMCSEEPGGYLGGVAEWDRFEQVARVAGIDVAIKSSSWGLGQIMGQNAQSIGYPTPQAFMKAMALHEVQQLSIMAGFIAANPAMHAALVSKNWAAFARAYNGPNYAAGRYDAKLASAYADFKATA